MGDFFGHLKARVEPNARRAAELYARELHEYRPAAEVGYGPTTLLDFALILRRRTAELAAEDRVFTGADLDLIAAVGRERGEKGVSLASQQQVLVLHSTLTLQEVQEAAGPNDIRDVMHMLGWLGPQGVVAQRAYTAGFLDGQKRYLSYVTRVQTLAGLLLTDDPTATAMARSLGMPLPSRCMVMVVRVADPDALGERREEILEILLKSHTVPMGWQRPEEYVALVRDEDCALSLVRDFAALTGRGCAAGAAPAVVGSAGGAVAQARRVSRAAPVEPRPGRVHTVADVFVELGIAQVPDVDRWLRDLATRLSDGPDLVLTLDAYYRHDMNRRLTAAALRVHPRTLDYRLGRVRDLTGIEPGSTHGVRALSAAVHRVLAAG